MSLLRRVLRTRQTSSGSPVAHQPPQPRRSRGLQWPLVVAAGVLMVVIASVATQDDRAEAHTNFTTTVAWITADASELRLEHQRVSYEDGEEVPYSQAQVPASHDTIGSGQAIRVQSRVRHRRSSKVSATSSSSVRSASTNIAFSPANKSSASASRSGLTSMTATGHPSSKRRSAAARPMPEAPPVTMADGFI